MVLFTFFQFYSIVSRKSKVHNFASFLFCWLLYVLVEDRWSVCMSKYQRSLCVSFSMTDAGLCIYHLYVLSNFNFLHILQLCLVLYSFCANLMHSLIYWLMVSSLSPHNLHLLFCCVLSILVLIWLVLMALFYATIRRDPVYYYYLLETMGANF